MFTPKVLSQYWSHQFSCIDCLLRAQLYQGQSILTETASFVLLRMHIIAQQIIAQHIITQHIIAQQIIVQNIIAVYLAALLLH